MLSEDAQFTNVWLQAHQEVKIPFTLRRRSARALFPSSEPGGAMTRTTEVATADDGGPGR
jgi:hypothetical protein